jgi:hypothetical protein
MVGVKVETGVLAADSDAASVNGDVGVNDAVGVSDARVVGVGVA